MQSGDSNFLASTIASQVIEAGCITATDGINGTRFGGERVRGFIDQRFGAVMDRSASTLSQGTRSNLGNGQQPVRGFCVKGLYFGAYRTNSVRGVAVDLAIKGVNLVASNATRLDHQTNLNAQDKPVRVVVLAATQLSSVAAGIEEGSTEWVMRVTRLAAWQVDDPVKIEKPIAETAVQQINEQVKTMQNIFCHRWSRPVGGLFSNLCGDFIGCAKDENRPLLVWCASRAAPHLLCCFWPSAFVFLFVSGRSSWIDSRCCRCPVRHRTQRPGGQAFVLVPAA
jgi:hypothetical protein